MWGWGALIYTMDRCQYRYFSNDIRTLPIKGVSKIPFLLDSLINRPYSQYLTVSPLPPSIPYLPRGLYLIIYFYFYLFLYGRGICQGLLHAAGRGLPLKDAAQYYTLRFPLYHRHSPYFPPDPIPNYLYIFIFKGRELCLVLITCYWTWAALHQIGSSSLIQRYRNIPYAVLMQEIPTPSFSK